MLGRLATWLRLLGYDTEYSQAEDDLLVRRAREERRILLTRDTGLLRRRQLPCHLYIQSDHVKIQVHQVVRSLALDLSNIPARRCARCNVVLESRTKADVVGRVPEFVWSHHDTFWGCQNCGRIYWAGSHRRRMDEAIYALTASDQAPSTATID